MLSRLFNRYRLHLEAHMMRRPALFLGTDSRVVPVTLVERELVHSLAFMTVMAMFPRRDGAWNERFLIRDDTWSCEYSIRYDPPDPPGTQGYMPMAFSVEDKEGHACASCSFSICLLRSESLSADLQRNTSYDLVWAIPADREPGLRHLERLPDSLDSGVLATVSWSAEHSLSGLPHRQFRLEPVRLTLFLGDVVTGERSTKIVELPFGTDASWKRPGASNRPQT